MVMIRSVRSFGPNFHSRLQSYIGCSRIKKFCLMMAKLLTVFGLILCCYTFACGDPINVKRWREAKAKTSTDSSLITGKEPWAFFATVCACRPFCNLLCACRPRLGSLFTLFMALVCTRGIKLLPYPYKEGRANAFADAKKVSGLAYDLPIVCTILARLWAKDSLADGATWIQWMYSYFITLLNCSL